MNSPTVTACLTSISTSSAMARSSSPNPYVTFVTGTVVLPLPNGLLCIPMNCKGVLSLWMFSMCVFRTMLCEFQE